jgi:hypothetical protein
MLKLIAFVGVLAIGSYIAMGKQWQDQFWKKGI